MRRTRWLFRLAALGVVAVLAAQTAHVLLTTGVKLGGDSGRYLEGADRLLHGEHLTAEDRAYLGYVGVVAAADWIGAGTAGVVAVQVLLLGLAALALFDLVRRLADRWTAMLAVALFALLPDWGSPTGWQAFILTDSIFTCGMVFVVWAAVRCSAQAPRATFVLVITALTVGMLRPNGWVLVTLAGGWCLLQRIGERRRAWGMALSLGVSVMGIAAVVGLAGSSTLARPNEQLRRGVVVWGTNAWRADMPRGPSRRVGQWNDLATYARAEPGATLELATRRVAAELAHVRPYYSRAHNAVLVLYLVPLYGLALLGAVATWQSATTRLLVVLIAAQMLTVAGFWADYDGRFLVYMIPLICVLAGLGGRRMFEALAPSSLALDHSTPTPVLPSR